MYFHNFTEIEEIEDAESRPSSPTAEAGSSQDDNNSPKSPGDRPEDPTPASKVETKSYMVPSSSQPNKAVTVALPKEVNVRRSSFTVIRSAEGVNEVVLLPKGRLINLSSMQAQDEDELEIKFDKDEAPEDAVERAIQDDEKKQDDKDKAPEEDDKDHETPEDALESASQENKKKQYDKDETSEEALERARQEEKKKKKAYYPNYKRKKGLSKTRAFHMRQSAVRLEIIDDFDEDIDIEDTGDEESIGSQGDESDNEETYDGGERQQSRGSPDEKIETEEVSLSGAFQSPDTDPESPSHSSIIPSTTSPEIECDIIVRTRKHNAKKKPVLPRSVGQSLKNAYQLRDALDSKSQMVIALDPPGDDHNYAWHPTRYITGPPHMDSRGIPIDKPEEMDYIEEKFELDPVVEPLQSPKRGGGEEKRGGGVKHKKSKQHKPVVKTIRGVGKVVSHPTSQSSEASNPRWVKVPARDKREPTDEEKKMKVCGL